MCIDLNYFDNHIKPKDHLVVDMRTQEERLAFNLTDDTFVIDKDDIPYYPSEVPSFFRTIPVVLLCSNGEFSKTIAENYTTEDSSFTDLYYIRDGHKGLPKDV